MKPESRTTNTRENNVKIQKIALSKQQKHRLKLFQKTGHRRGLDVALSSDQTQIVWTNHKTDREVLRQPVSVLSDTKFKS